MSLSSLIIHHDILGRKSRPHLTSNRAFLHYAIFLLIFLLAANFIRITQPGILGFSTNISATELFEATNQARVDNGLNNLALSETLSRAARNKAEHMFEHNYWAHVGPDGKEPWDFILEEGYDYIYAGENLARDFATSQGVVDAWMDSTTHRANVLNPNYTEIGFAVVNGEIDGIETTLVVQMFGTPRFQPAVIETGEPAPVEEQQTPSVLELDIAEEYEPIGASLEHEKTIPVRQESLFALSPLENGAADNRVISIPVFDVEDITRNVSLYFIVFLLVMFAIDGVVVFIREHNRHTGHAAIHFLFFLFLLTAVLIIKTGSIL